MKILFVCHGNINRSAACEIIAKQLHKDWQIKSAGIINKNNLITAKKMREELTKKGYNEYIRSKQIDKGMVDWADIIFYMDKGNENNLVKMFGLSILNKSRNIANLIGEKKIPDPHFSKGSDEHKKVIEMIEKCICKIKEKQMQKIIAICGTSGVGKTEIITKFMEDKKFESKKIGKLIHTLYNKKRDLHIIGIYDNSLFAGTDKLSMSVQPEVQKWIEECPSNILFEGDKLSTKTFFQFIKELPNTQFLILLLEVPKNVLEKRYKKRGSNQSEKILKIRETKYTNIKYEPSIRKFIRIIPNENLEDQEKIIKFLEKNFDGREDILDSFKNNTSSNTGITKFLKG